ncbi:DUF2232 domain-containing protein [Terrisporobacter sp.]|uniref:DUF2232 domain-containing protein n=1 Tax=Terrisporobacter sp. TaxID=1965305 RepID=UPI0026317FF4|nr:DUF2232 domain-containing protein [Terrisporobacter sp.]
MNSSVKKLTEAGILSSAFVVLTMIALTTGLGYGIYLDFGVPIIFVLIYFRCDLKYTLLSGITSTIIIIFVLGNFATGILISQSFLLGILCGYLLSRPSGIFDDLFLGAILGLIFMVLIDIYARNLIGYSFMKEFQGYIDYIMSKPKELTFILPYIENINFAILYYLLIAIFPFGMFFSIYFISLLCGKRLKLLSKVEKQKYFMMRSLKTYGNFMNIKNKSFYLAILYIIIINIFNFTNIEFNSVYLKTISICIEYISYYFVIRDVYLIIGNYINAKFRKRNVSLLYLIITIFLLVNIFKITVLIYTIVSIILDKKFNLRLKQRHIVDSHTDKLLEYYKN